MSRDGCRGHRELFAAITPVRVRRMFGGHRIDDGEIMFALESGGEIVLKADADSEGRFAAASSSPFVCARGGKPFAMSYWRLPDAAFDDGDVLRIWTELALAAARRSAPGQATWLVASIASSVTVRLRPLRLAIISA